MQLFTNHENLLDKIEMFIDIGGSVEALKNAQTYGVFYTHIKPLGNPSGGYLGRFITREEAEQEIRNAIERDNKRPPIYETDYYIKEESLYDYYDEYMTQRNQLRAAFGKPVDGKSKKWLQAIK